MHKIINTLLLHYFYINKWSQQGGKYVKVSNQYYKYVLQKKLNNLKKTTR